MLRRMMDILCCPLCRGELTLSIRTLTRMERASGGPAPGCRNRCEYAHRLLLSEGDRERSHGLCGTCYWEDVTEGTLSCPDGHAFQISESIPRMLPGEKGGQRTRETFDMGWKGFQYGKKIYGHSEEEELEDFFQRMAVDEGFIRQKTVLDAGCGMGRLARSMSRLAREVIAMDFSEGVEKARETVWVHPRVHVVMGDLKCPPFRVGAFDYVYSKGVLHYVADPRGCVANLADLVRAGGALSITLYPRMSPTFAFFNQGLKLVTTKLPIRLVSWLSHLLSPLLPFSWRWSGVLYRPIERDDRVHMIFNWLSSEFQNMATNEDVVEWFRALGFVDMKISPVPVGITAIKPVSAGAGLSGTTDSAGCGRRS